MDRPIRLMEMLQLLGGRRSWRPAELAERFGMSERNIYRDLQALTRLYGIPVTNDEHGYRLLEGATLRSLPLTATERAMLTLLLRHPALGALSDLTAGLARKLDVATRQLEETPQALTLAGPEQSGRIGEGILPLLEQATRERTPVSLLYRSLWSRRQTWRGLDPYAVFHRENAWYLVGHCHERRELRAFRLDRIADADLLDGEFAPPDFDLGEFLKHSWGIYHGRTVYDVVIHFDAALAALLEGSTLHPDQRVVRLGNGDLAYRVSLSHLEEIARWIVGFAGAARAVEPPALVELVADMAAGAHEAHRREDTPKGSRGQRDLPHVRPGDGDPPRQGSLI